MKTACIILAVAALLCGCNKPAAPAATEPAKYETGTIAMWDSDSMRDLGYTHHTLMIWTKSGIIKTNVETLDHAANILGQYGWELVSAATDGHQEIYHLKRQSQAKGQFSLSPEH
jgi:dissimilatory sulfite reductase (desulfoviridin) alpha/beta subunit